MLYRRVYVIGRLRLLLLLLLLTVLVTMFCTLYKQSLTAERTRVVVERWRGRLTYVGHQWIQFDAGDMQFVGE